MTFAVPKLLSKIVSFGFESQLYVTVESGVPVNVIVADVPVHVGESLAMETVGKELTNNVKLVGP